METVVPQTTAWLAPPRAFASDVVGSLFPNVPVSDGASRTTRPASSRRTCLGGCIALEKLKSEWMSPRTAEPRGGPDLTKRPLLSLRRSECGGRIVRVGLELGSYRIGEDSARGVSSVRLGAAGYRSRARLTACEGTAGTGRPISHGLAIGHLPKGRARRHRLAISRRLGVRHLPQRRRDIARLALGIIAPRGRR